MLSVQTRKRTGIVAVASSVTFLAFHDPPAAPSSTPAAAPWIILIEGERPGTRTVFSDWHVNHRLMTSIARPATVETRTLSARSSLRVALFWGHEWAQWREARIDPETLSFDRANQQARLYRATSTVRAVWVFGPMSGLVPTPPPRIRWVDSSGMALLKSRGVPVAVSR